MYGVLGSFPFFKLTFTLYHYDANGSRSCLLKRPTTASPSVILANKLSEFSGTETKHRNLKKKDENSRDDNFSKNSRMGFDMTLV